MERRLAAILAADVVGYSRMIRADEEGTLVALRMLRDKLINPKIGEHDGRIVKLMGDGMRAEFASVVDAVACSVDVQNGMAERNANAPEAQHIVFRIGINLGDVVIDGDDIQGDGVNVAARLETLSEAGGICISNAVHEQVRDRLDLPFEDIGNQEVKNIDRPVRAWRWFPAGQTVAPKTASDVKSLPLPDKPSIAVLPFTNMSDDPEQEYFTDGITEDIITELSRFRSLFVIARNSSFHYKGKSSRVQDVGGELGVA
ncbi:MAG: adenylate/guanylate cyclase domain-containing protein [Hyphomicrobiaceae bacterium]